MPVEWDPAPPTTKQRILAGLLLALMIFTSANLFFDWGVFRGYDGQVTGACFIVAFVVFTRFMPGARRV
jgi:hypothetical protein